MSPARRRGPSGCLVASLVLLLLAVGVLVGVDRWVAHRTEAQVASTVRQQLQLAEDPQIDFLGFPFLTQAASNRFGEVDMVGHGLMVPARTPLRVNEVRLRFQGVNTSDGYRVAVADQVSGTATVDWSELDHQLGVPVRPEPDGRVSISIRPRLMGQSTTVVVRGRPVLDEATQKLSFTDLQARVASVDVPPEVLEPLAQEYLPEIPLELPIGLRATGVRVEQPHAVLELGGRDVRISG